jgi:succinoglycan biosynthesis protein ExoU
MTMRAHESRAAIVDVLIAAWNCSDTIERAVCSALAQPEVQRVIVVDDGSSDDTAGPVRRLERRGERVMPVELSTNRGPSAARNRALEIATAPWVAILDGDDFLLPGRMGKLLAHAAERDVVADDILRALEPRLRRFRPRQRRPSQPPKGGVRLFQTIDST